MVVGEKTPPQFVGHVAYWERCPDPLHQSAFATTQARMGWLAVDWAEDPIGWVADGTELPGAAPSSIIQPGLYRIPCAYPDTKYGHGTIAKHRGEEPYALYA